MAGDYSPEFGCILEGTGKAVDFFAPIIGGTRPGLFVSSNFLPGSPAYTYPGEPADRERVRRPQLPWPAERSEQAAAADPGTTSPFLVTDNAYVPYQPNTELQFDAPSTVQFLFNGAFAERDDY